MTTERIGRATAGLPAPLAVVDLDRFDANASLILHRAAGRPVRVASKSVRVRSLIERALAGGFRGVMAYSLPEASWLVRSGVRDVLIGYPSVDRAALAELAADPVARREITLMVDDVAHVDLAAAVLGHGSASITSEETVGVCLDIDASLRLGVGGLSVHLGTRRSPLRSPEQAVAVARAVEAAPGLRLRGLMCYEAQVAGIPDGGPLVSLVKRASLRDVDLRRRAVLAAVRAAVGHDLELINAGGTGSLEASAAGTGVTEVTAGSGLYQPALFDGYRRVRGEPAAWFGLDVTRLPAPGWATAFGGGYIASGPAGRSRLPRPVGPGWSLTRAEGAGEVQTPLRRRRRAEPLGIGDRVWFRHAKAGELMERFDVVHLVRGDEVVESVPTYRGEGDAFG